LIPQRFQRHFTFGFLLSALFHKVYRTVRLKEELCRSELPIFYPENLRRSGRRDVLVQVLSHRNYMAIRERNARGVVE
jgi:hypothetical protein